MAFAIGEHQYEIRTVSSEHIREKRYEIWIDGNPDGKANPWPLDAQNNPLTEQQLIEEKIRLETELHQRREELRLGRFRTAAGGK